MSTLKNAMKIADAKFCAFYSCTNNSYRCNDLQFFPFPKACPRVACNSIKADTSHIRICPKCKRCQRWSIACKISVDLWFKAHRLYICGKHFVNGHPLNKYPDPMSDEMIEKIKNYQNHPTTYLPSLNGKLAPLHDFRDVLSVTSRLFDKTYSRVLLELKRSQSAVSSGKIRQNISLEKNKRNEMEVMDKLNTLKGIVTELDRRLMTSFEINCADRAPFKESNESQADMNVEIEKKHWKRHKSNLQKELQVLQNLLGVEEEALEDKAVNIEVIAPKDFPAIVLIVDSDDDK